MVDMLLWAIDNPAPANFFLISGDRDFAYTLHQLRMRRYNILLAQPPHVSAPLVAAANHVWLWTSLVNGSPPLSAIPSSSFDNGKCNKSNNNSLRVQDEGVEDNKKRKAEGVLNNQNSKKPRKDLFNGSLPLSAIPLSSLDNGNCNQSSNNSLGVQDVGVDDNKKRKAEGVVNNRNSQNNKKPREDFQTNVAVIDENNSTHISSHQRFKEVKIGERKFFTDGQQTLEAEGLVFRCQLCGKKHLGKSCAGKSICYNCQKEGHFSKKCPNDASSTANTAVVSAKGSVGAKENGLVAFGFYKDGLHKVFKQGVGWS